MICEKPDLCCLVEIDRGSAHSARFNQILALLDDEYRYHDIADKYGQESPLGKMPLHSGKSNGFLARNDLVFERLYFRNGTKRLVYRIELPDGAHLFFAHFSLNRKVRTRQFREVHDLVRGSAGPVILLADFNILRGFSELKSLVEDTGLSVMNREEDPTFTFHKNRLPLDLCLCTRDIAERISLRIIPQPFSDHAALLVEV